MSIIDDYSADFGAEKPKIKVSDEFVKIFKNFNVISQVEEMSKLTPRELYLLLLTCVDSHQKDDPIAKYNWKAYEKELREVYEIQDGKENSKNEILIALAEETDYEYISVDNLVDMNGDKLPSPLNKEEVRDARVDIINGDNK